MNFLQIAFNQKATESHMRWNTMLIVAMALITLWVISVINIGFILPVYLFVMGVVSVLIFLSPSLGLPIILLATIWFQSWFTLEPIVIRDAVYKFYPLDLLYLTTLFSYFFHHLFAKQPPKFYLKKLGGVFLLFFALVIIWFIRAFVESGADKVIAFSSLKNYVFYGFFYFLVIYSIRNLQDLKRIIKIFLIGGYGVMVFVFWGLLRGQGVWTELNILSTEGIRFLSFPHAFYLSLALIISLVLYVYKLRPQQQSLIALWLFSLGLVVSLFRHLWAAILATTFMLLFLLPKTARGLLYKFIAKNTAFLSLIGVLLAFIAIIFPLSNTAIAITDIAQPFYDRVASLANTTRDESANFRYRSWAAAKENLAEQPFVGIGFGQDLIVDFDRYRLVLQIRDLHNSLLVLLVQMGMIGFSVFAFALALIMKKFYDAWRARGIYWPYQLAFFALWALFMGASFWQPYFEANFTGIFFWIITGLLIVSIRLGEEEHVST